MMLTQNTISLGSLATIAGLFVYSRTNMKKKLENKQDAYAFNATPNLLQLSYGKHSALGRR